METNTQSFVGIEIVGPEKYMKIIDRTPTENRWEKVIEDYLGIEIPDQKIGPEKVAGLRFGLGYGVLKEPLLASNVEVDSTSPFGELDDDSVSNSNINNSDSYVNFNTGFSHGIPGKSFLSTGSHTFFSGDGRKSLTLFADGKVVQRECYDNHSMMRDSCDLDSMPPLEGKVDPLKASLLLAALGVPDIVLDPVNVSVMAELYSLQDALREAAGKDAIEQCPMKVY